MLEAHRKNDIMINIGDYPVEIKTSSYRENTNLQSNFFFLKIIFLLKSIPHLKSVTRMQPSYPMHDVTLVSPLFPHSSEDTKIILSVIALVDLLITYFLEMSVSSWMSTNQPTKLLS